MSVGSTLTHLLVATLEPSVATDLYLNEKNSGYYTAKSNKVTTHSTLLIKSENSNFKKLEGELYSYLDLEENWDGYDGVIPDKKIIDSCQVIIEKLKKSGLDAPKSMLTGAGEVGLYWKADKAYIELSFEENNTFSYIIDNGDTITGEEGCPKNENLPIKLLVALEKNTKEKSIISGNRNSLSSMYKS